MDGVLTPHWNVLQFPFELQLEEFLQIFPSEHALRSSTMNQRLSRLSTLLKQPLFTIQLARIFSPLLVELCSHWLDDQESDVQKFIAFSILVPICEEIYPYVFTIETFGGTQSEFFNAES